MPLPGPRSKVPALALAVLALLLAATLVDAPWPREQGLQQFGTAGGVACYVVAWRRWKASNTALLLFAAFLALHVVGARWIYSYVPYDDACEALFGCRPGERLGWSRNHYERFVHAAYGVLALPLFAEAVEKELALARRAALAIAVTIVIATSALYELGEWLVALVAAPDHADRYLGQQGDAWDAQKDMALATAGACVTAVVLALRRTRGRPSR